MCEIKDPFEILKLALNEMYDSSLPPWKQSKAYFDELEKFCQYSKKWIQEEEKDIVRPKNSQSGETKRGTTEFDVFNALSIKRLERNGIHGQFCVAAVVRQMQLTIGSGGTKTKNAAM